jgi:hypothetical protein
LQLHEVIPMHWLIAAMLSANSAIDLRGLRPRNSQDARWSMEWERLERSARATSAPRQSVARGRLFGLFPAPRSRLS